MTTILAAEDSYALANLLGFVLKNAGFTANVVRTGTAALEAGLAARYDILLFDQQMPGLTGIEVIEALRSSGPNQQSPVFLCTAKTHELELDDIRSRLSVRDIIHKPFSPKALVEALQSVATSDSCGSK